MLSRTILSRGLRGVSLAAALGASSLAWAGGGTIHVTNNSKEPWCLRLSQGVRLALRVQCPKDAPPLDLPRENLDHVCCIPPGETCSLRFKQTSPLPFQAELGLVDRTGTESGVLKVESAPSTQELKATPKTEVPGVLESDAEDSIGIHADSWWI